ncbi:lipoprotein signal peptidase [Psychromonas sp. CNPT3]|uniref:signal peptidase II n=1 Tax=Psychromonas sp. CNPT3 TaxID=314282 RepID=UPI00006E7624|nr:signal peptidase II [Psychromonas sp. CNPT3]AGH80355.1 lipoprotein signal peptidase [Psychromonas sp. CNPT3]
MTQNVEKSGIRWLWLTMLILLLDQASKYWVVEGFELHQSIEVYSFFNFTYARNYGAAFSFLGDAGGWQRYLFTAIAVLVSAFLVHSLYKNRVTKSRENIAFALILAGALGNLVDRLMFGYVVDFLDFDLGFYRWPTFNVADISIFIGAALLILDGIFNASAASIKEEKENEHH